MELYQRIEHLIGKQLPLHQTVEEEVMALMERVTDAQRITRMVGHTVYPVTPPYVCTCVCI